MADEMMVKELEEVVVRRFRRRYAVGRQHLLERVGYGWK